MKRRKLILNLTKRSLKALGLTIVGVATMRSAHAATTFDYEGMSHNADIPQTFGDNVVASGTGYSATSGLFVVGTPNIGLTWGNGVSHLVDSYQNWDGRGTVAQLDFTRLPSPPPVQTISIMFTPDSPAYGALITSFFMDEYSGGGAMDVDWSVSDGTGTLASGNWTRSSGGRDQIFTGLTPANVTLGETVTLMFSRNSGTGSYFALDNLAFDQVQAVPEPSTVALLALAGLGLGARAMRRRK